MRVVSSCANAENSKGGHLLVFERIARRPLLYVIEPAVVVSVRIHIDSNQVLGERSILGFWLQSPKIAMNEYVQAWVGTDSVYCSVAGRSFREVVEKQILFLWQASKDLGIVGGDLVPGDSVGLAAVRFIADRVTEFDYKSREEEYTTGFLRWSKEQAKQKKQMKFA